MRMVFVAAGSPATVFALAPLATAARNAGHEVIMTGTAEVTPVITGVGLPAVPVCAASMQQLMFTDRDGTALRLPTDPGQRMRFGGHGFGRLAAASLATLGALGRDWRPDLVVGGALAFGAALLASELKVPYLGHAWDLGEPVEMTLGAAEELRPELDRQGLAELPEPDLWIDICPSSVAAAAPPARRVAVMRFVPAGRQQPLERWMYTRAERRRVCLTAGSRVSREHHFGYLDELVGRLRRPDLEVVVAAPEEVAAALRDKHPGVRAGWLPLDTVLRTCDVLVHSGGGQTSLTAMVAGVPQLIIPTMPKVVAPSLRLSGYGAAVTLLSEVDSAQEIPGGVEDACRALLDNPGYRDRAGALAAEIAALPGPAQVLPAIESLLNI